MSVQPNSAYNINDDSKFTIDSAYSETEINDYYDSDNVSNIESVNSNNKDLIDLFDTVKNTKSKKVKNYNRPSVKSRKSKKRNDYKNIEDDNTLQHDNDENNGSELSNSLFFTHLIDSIYGITLSTFYLLSIKNAKMFIPGIKISLFTFAHNFSSTYEKKCITCHNK